MVDLTDIRLPAWEFAPTWARVAWVSAEARRVWEPRVGKLKDILETLSVHSVYHGLRPSAMVFRTAGQLGPLTQEALDHGCVALALDQTDQTIRNAADVVVPNPNFRVVVTKDPAPWATAFKNHDELVVGKLLGYPECCSKVYDRLWREEKWIDTTYPMSRAGTEGPIEVNILLRWWDIRAIRHLPCSFDCEPSAVIGRETLAFGEQLGYVEEMAWLREMLSWNVEWTSLHGIAEIRTPCFKMSANTDPLKTKVVVQKHGTRHPEEGAQGLEFPFEVPKFFKVTQSKSYKASLGISAWKDNGFQSQEAMDAAHAELLTVIPTLPQGAHILDLGCGDGTLLEKICDRGQDLMPHGVDVEPNRVRRAYQRLNWGFFAAENIKTLSWADQAYELIIFMPGRLSEMSPSEASAILDAVKRCGKRVVLYAYGDRIADLRLAVLGEGFQELTRVSRANVTAALLERHDHAEA